jgi:hypothetical protein
MNNQEWGELGCGLVYRSEPEYALFCIFWVYTVCGGLKFIVSELQQIVCDASSRLFKYAVYLRRRHTLEYERHNKVLCQVFYLILQILSQCLR